MGNTPYILMVAAVLLFGAILPQKGPQRKYYILLMTVLHTCLCGFRWQWLTGDLHKYYWNYFNCGSYPWFSPELWAGGRNFGFYYFNKIIYTLFGDEQQALLFCIALIVHVALAIVVYRYSPAPWFSYLIWNCMGFYIFGFSAIKQALAMAFVMLSFIGIEQKRLGLFVSMMAIAGSIHMPALIFLPTYWLAKLRLNSRTMMLYIIIGIAVFVFKDQFVMFIRSFYYEDDELIAFGEIGSRFIMVLGFCLFGLLFRGFQDPVMESLFPIMAVAAALQLLSGYDHIFTRLTDYYFQMSVLYIPMTFFSGENARQNPNGMNRIFPFNKRSLVLMGAVVALFAVWFYWTYSINITISYEVDNYLNYRSMWDVK